MAYNEYVPKNKYMISAFQGINDHEHINSGQWQNALNMTCDEYPAAKTRARRTEITGYRSVSASSRGYMDTGYAPERGSYVFALVDNSLTPPETPFRLRFYKSGGSVIELNCTKVTQTTADNVTVKELACEFGFSQPVPYADAKAFVPESTGNVEWAQDAQLTGRAVDAVAYYDDLYLLTDAGRVSCGTNELKITAGTKHLVPYNRGVVTETGIIINEKCTGFDTVEKRITVLEPDITLCNMECTDITAATSKPANPSDGDYFYDTQNNGLYRYSSAWTQWISVTESYIKIEITNLYDISGLREGDALRVKIGTETSAYTVYKILQPTENEAGCVVLNGLINPPSNVDVTFERRMPVLDYICEHENRIWGCRYGLNDDEEFVNEIYCSAQGDARNWFLFEGTAHDSWTTSVGEPGPWTGCCECGEYVLFFKADKVFVVHGSEPGNFGYTTLDDFGVQPGSEKSLCVIDNYAYYKSEHGIMRMGVNSYPVCISRALGPDVWTDAVGDTDGRKYYVAMTGPKGRYLYVYDTETGTWMKEREPEGMQVIARYKNNLLAVCGNVTDTLIDIKAAYDEGESQTQKATTLYATWKTRDLISRYTVPLKDAAGLAALTHVGGTTLQGIYENLLDAVDDGYYYVSVKPIFAYTLKYVWLNAELTQNMTTPATAYAYSGTTMSRTALVGVKKPEPDFSWYAETGLLGLEEPDHKRMRIAQLRRKTGENGEIAVKIKYDGDEEWTELWHEHGKKTGTIRVSFPPSCRCDMYRLRFEGAGDNVIYSVTINQEEAGDHVR